MAHAPFHFGLSDRSREPVFPRLNDFFRGLFDRGGPSPLSSEGRTTAVSGPGRVQRGVGVAGPQLATDDLPRTSGSSGAPSTGRSRLGPSSQRPGIGQTTKRPKSQFAQTAGGPGLPPIITFGSTPPGGVGEVGVTGTVQLRTDTPFGQAVGGVIHEFQGDPDFANSVFRLLGVDPRNGPRVLAAFQQEYNRTVAIFGGDEDLAQGSFIDMLRNRIENQGLAPGFGGTDDFDVAGEFESLRQTIEDLRLGGVQAIEEGEGNFGPIIDPRLDPNQDEFRFFEE